MSPLLSKGTAWEFPRADLSLNHRRPLIGTNDGTNSRLYVDGTLADTHAAISAFTGYTSANFWIEVGTSDYGKHLGYGTGATC